MDIIWRDLIGNFFGVKPPPIPEEPEERRKDPRAAAGIQVALEWYTPDGEIRTGDGVLENVSPHGFGIRADANIVEGQTVWVTRPESPALKSIVRHVQTEDGVCVLGCARIPQERRREDRLPVAGSGQLRRTGFHGEALAVDVEIRNVSSEGVQVTSPEFVPKHEVARLIGSAVECTGTVRYSVPCDGGFLVGLFLIGKVRRNAPPGEVSVD